MNSIYKKDTSLSFASKYNEMHKMKKKMKFEINAKNIPNGSKNNSRPMLENNELNFPYNA